MIALNYINYLLFEESIIQYLLLLPSMYNIYLIYQKFVNVKIGNTLVRMNVVYQSCLFVMVMMIVGIIQTRRIVQEVTG